MVASSLENCANCDEQLMVRFLYFGLGGTMTPHSIEIHAFLIILMLALLTVNCVTMFMLISIMSDIKALRIKMRLLGFKLATPKDIKEYNDG